MRGRLIAVAFILIIFGFGVGAIQQTYFEAGIDGGAANTLTETVSVDEGNVTELSQSNVEGLVYADQDDITVEQGGDTFIPQGNWSWNQHNGTIRWISGSSLSDGGNADVTYTIADPTNEQNLIKTLAIDPLATYGDTWVLIAGLILVFAALAIVARNA